MRCGARTFPHGWEKKRGVLSGGRDPWTEQKNGYNPIAAMKPSIPTRPTVTPHAASVGDERTSDENVQHGCLQVHAIVSVNITSDFGGIHGDRDPADHLG